MYLTATFPKIAYFDPETTQAINDIKVLIGDYVKEETAKFVTGLRPLEEIDSYFAALESLGVEELLSYYADYYASLDK